MLSGYRLSTFWKVCPIIGLLLSSNLKLIEIYLIYESSTKYYRPTYYAIKNYFHV